MVNNAVNRVVFLLLGFMIMRNIIITYVRWNIMVGRWSYYLLVVIAVIVFNVSGQIGGWLSSVEMGSNSNVFRFVGCRFLCRYVNFNSSSVSVFKLINSGAVDIKVIMNSG